MNSELKSRMGTWILELRRFNMVKIYSHSSELKMANRNNPSRVETSSQCICKTWGIGIAYSAGIYQRQVKTFIELRLKESKRPWLFYWTLDLFDYLVETNDVDTWILDVLGLRSSEETDRGN